MKISDANLKPLVPAATTRIKHGPSSIYINKTHTHTKMNLLFFSITDFQQNIKKENRAQQDNINQSQMLELSHRELQLLCLIQQGLWRQSEYYGIKKYKQRDEKHLKAKKKKI